jgi:adenylate kinase
VESTATTAALRDLDTANNEVEQAIKNADSASLSAQRMSESLLSVLENMQRLLDEAKARIASLIELVQRIQSKSSSVG